MSNNSSFALDYITGNVYGSNTGGKHGIFIGNILTDKPIAGLITPRNSLLIDSKIDDSLPNKGSFSITRGLDIDAVNGVCVDQPRNVTASTVVNFVLSDNTKSCLMIKWINYLR
jgi:hypothetical protein